MAITFQSQGYDFRLREQQILRRWILAVISGEKKTAGQLNFLFTSDDELLKINRQFLQHDTYTDIITFDSSENDKVAGDIVISVERVKENAEKFAVPFASELYRVMIHGVLHLCGYKDKARTHRAEMRKKEDIALKKLGSLRT